MACRQAIAVRRYCIPMPHLKSTDCNPPDADIRIAHVSDFHFRRWNDVLDHARFTLMVRDYDLLLVTGDFSSIPCRWRHAADMCRRFFDGIDPPLGTYAVLGNHDSSRLARQPGLPFTWLRNENIRLTLDTAAFYLAGVDQSDGAFGDVPAALAGIPETEPVILMAHYPSTVYDLPPGRVQLLLSGHTHGGQIRLPGVGCLFTNDRVPTRMARGLHRVGDTLLHVSPGIGVSGPIRHRFRCPPEISFIALRPTQTTLTAPHGTPRHTLEHPLAAPP